jgi:hypothetical protein
MWGVVGRSEGAELEGENKRGGGVDWLKPMCEGDGGMRWHCTGLDKSQVHK